MKYHYQKGIIEKEKSTYKIKFLIIVFILAGGYGAFSYLVLSLNGVPLLAKDTAAALVKQTKPGSKGDTLLIPSINLSAKLGEKLAISGDLEEGRAVIKGRTLALGVTPYQLRNNSPFYNLAQLKDGDEIFVDKNNTRFAYRVVADKTKNHTLTLKSDTKVITAKPIGTVAWKNGNSQLEAL